MKKLFIIIILIYSISNVSAQTVKFQGISKVNIDLTKATIVGQVTISPATPGKAIVHFDGKCVSDVGDRIVLAASDNSYTGVNDGSVQVEAFDADLNTNSFSHTRVYDITTASKSKTFYAVAENVVETDGSGKASIYGSLTVEFIPDGVSVVDMEGISETNIDLTSETTLGQVTIRPTTSGKAIVRFDGSCISDVGDRIILAASDNTSWGVDDGSTSVEAINSDVNVNSFSHTRVYDVSAGIKSKTFYAVAQNYVETDGTGKASIYGSLTVEFIPDGDYVVNMEGISKSNIDLTNETTLGQITIRPATSGIAIVHFDGRCLSEVGDRIVLAASDNTSWGSNDGSVSAEAYDKDVNRSPFSHTRVYDVPAGIRSKTFYAVAQTYVETDGSGKASIFGSLTVKFIPTAIVNSINNNYIDNSIEIYPNPTNGEFLIDFNEYKHSVVEIINSNGQLIQSLEVNGSTKQINIEDLSKGVYFVKIGTGDKIVTKKIIKD